MKKRALISVYNKDGVLDLASFLVKSGWEIISTGGTSRYLSENNIPVMDVSSVTNFPECLDGRVKTLHPAIHAGILAIRDQKLHMDTLAELNLETIDLVCVNLYPFFEKVKMAYMPAEVLNPALDEIIEYIDIGGPAMLRSAAKNFRDVIVICDPADYADVIESIKDENINHDLKKQLAGKVFNLTSAYDAAIARYLLETESASTNKDPEFWPLSLLRSQSLRYGENNHQSAALYLHADKLGALGGMEQLHGKELGYNNIRDLDLAWKSACAFGLSADGTTAMGEEEVLKFVPGGSSGNKVCCSAVKHNTPCGIALGDTLLEAYEKAYACDLASIFGGIIAVNTAVDVESAKKLGELFLEIIVAPEFDDEALEILKKKKNLRIIKAQYAPREIWEFIAVDGGMLVQSTDNKLLEKWECPTKLSPDEGDLKDLVFAYRAVSFVKSNAILLAKDLASTGIGGGQVNRLWPAQQAIERSNAVLKDGNVRVLASDAFIPFPDVIEAAHAGGIKTIIQPGGSINDKAVIESCNNYEISMIFTGLRHFKH